MILQLRLALLLLKCKSMSARHNIDVYFYFNNNTYTISVIHFSKGYPPFAIVEFEAVNAKTISKINDKLNKIKLVSAYEK